MSANDLYGTRIPSAREQRVIHLVAQGLKNWEVAEKIGTTEHVVKNYLRAIYDKLDLQRVELALGTNHGGWVPPPLSLILLRPVKPRSVALSDLTDAGQNPGTG